MLRDNNSRLNSLYSCQFEQEESFEPLLLKKVKLDTSVSEHTLPTCSDTEMQSESQSVASMNFSWKTSQQIIDIFQSVMQDLQKQESCVEDKWDGQSYFPQMDYFGVQVVARACAEVPDQAENVKIASEPKKLTETPLDDTLWTPFSKQKVEKKRGRKSAKGKNVKKGREQ